MSQVFVYGTLLPGEERWSLLEPFSEAVGEATADGTLWDTRRGYPAAVFDGSGAIPGAVVVIKAGAWDAVIDLLDRVEGEGTLYRRVEVTTSAGPATSYEWMGPTIGMQPLPSGWQRGPG